MSNSSYWREYEARNAHVLSGSRERRPTRKALENSNAAQNEDATNEPNTQGNTAPSNTAPKRNSPPNRKGFSITTVAATDTGDISDDTAQASPSDGAKPSSTANPSKKSKKNPHHTAAPDQPTLAPQAKSPPKNCNAAKSNQLTPVTVTVTKTATTEPATKSGPAHQKATSKSDFLNLPNTDPCCVAVDTEHGRWVDCKCGERKMMRIDQPFTLSYWNDHHKGSITHHRQLAEVLERERVSSKVKSEDPTLRKTECRIHELYSKK
jgi:hypothetical protein